MPEELPEDLGTTILEAELDRNKGAGVDEAREADGVAIDANQVGLQEAMDEQQVASALSQLFDGADMLLARPWKGVLQLGGFGFHYH